MSEDRTQPPSKRRRELAREQGQVAHSPELTAAAGWLAALLLLGSWSEDLTRALVDLVRSPLTSPVAVWADPLVLVAEVRAQFAAVALPLGVVLGGFVAGAAAAHQLQVRGLWAVGLIAPDPSRLWTLGRGQGLGAGIERSLWALVKAVTLVAVSAWAVRSGWTEIQRLSQLGFPELAGAAGSVVLRPARVLALVMLVLGLADYGLRYLRFEAMLRTTPEEQREDQRAMEGDTALRAKRRRIARAWRGDAPELLAGASLVLGGAGGLTLVLSGGPPPKRILVRTAAKGAVGLRLRRSAAAMRLPSIDAPDLAQRLARASSAAVPSSLPPDLVADLASAWPVSRPTP